MSFDYFRYDGSEISSKRLHEIWRLINIKKISIRKKLKKDINEIVDKMREKEREWVHGKW